MPPPRILVVDDDRATVMLVTRILQRGGYAVISAMDPVQGLGIAQREVPAVIVSDLGMPAGGGFNFLEGLGRSSRTQAIPVVVLTASADPAHAARALEAGAVQVLQKPVDGPALLEAIRGILGPAAGGSAG
jgi:CheY-like chemotaxis protein